MNDLPQKVVAAAIAEVGQVGFALVRQLEPEVETSVVASHFGRVIDISEILKTQQIPDVQTLEPTITEHSSLNRYSGHFGRRGQVLSFAFTLLVFCTGRYLLAGD